MKSKATRAVIHNFPSMKAKESAPDVLVDVLPLAEVEPEGKEVDDATSDLVAVTITELILVDEATAVEFKAPEEEGPSAAKAGAGTALLGSTSLPTPHGIASPDPGCFGLAGGVVAPVADAMVKRVVQVLSVV